MTITLLVVLIVGAVWRVTRLITKDTIADPFRSWVENHTKAKAGRKVWTFFDDLIVCPWCVSIYISAGLVALADRYYSVPAPVFVWLTASAVTGLLVMSEPD